MKSKELSFIRDLNKFSYMKISLWGKLKISLFNKLEREEIVGKINSQSFRKFFLPDLIESIFFPLLSLVQF